MTRVSGIGRARHGSRSSDTRDTHSHLVPAPVATLQAPHLGLLILVGDVGLGRLTLGRDRLMALGDDVEPFESIAERSEERRVGKECVSTCRFRGWPYN